MKKILLVFCALLFALLLLPGLLRPPAQSAVADQVRVQELAHALGTALLEYHAEYGHYPPGTPGEMLQALRGANPQGRIFFDLPREALNDHGELLDPWGTPFRISYDPVRQTPRIHSAGPNLIPEEKAAFAWLSGDDFTHHPQASGR